MSLGIGVGLVVITYSHGGLSAPFPFNCVGLLGFFLIGYVIITFGVTDKKGDNYKLLADMIRSAKESMRIFSGDLDSNVYLQEVEGKTLIGFLVDKATKGVRIEIITQRESDSKTTVVLRNMAEQGSIEAVRKNLKIFQLRPPIDTSLEHFMVVDDLWVRVEKVHGTGRPSQKCRSVRFSLYLHSLLNEEFATLLAKSMEIPF